VLEAISRAEITLTQVESGDDRHWHLKTLPELVKQVLGYLGLSEAVYTRRGGIHTISHKFQLSTLSIRERGVAKHGPDRT
jgi:hypothetical protein